MTQLPSCGLKNLMMRGNRHWRKAVTKTTWSSGGGMEEWRNGVLIKVDPIHYKMSRITI